MSGRKVCLHKSSYQELLAFMITVNIILILVFAHTESGKLLPGHTTPTSLECEQSPGTE